MARKKEISREKILEVAYKMAITSGMDGMTARSIAKMGHFSTQPLYLEFENMEEIKNEVLNRISKDLQEDILQKEFTGQPLIDLDLSYITYAEKHTKLFKAMFVDGKFGSKVIAKALKELGIEKLQLQFPDADFDQKKIEQIVTVNWITTIGMAALIVNQIASFSQEQIVNVLNAQVHEAMVNDDYALDNKNNLLAVED